MALTDRRGTITEEAATPTFTERRHGVTEDQAVKAACAAATTANITLSGLQTLDGVTLVADDRVLVKDQSDASENGIYVASSGTWTRALDFDGARDVVFGTQVLVMGGTNYALTTWMVTTADPIFIGDDDIDWDMVSTGVTSSASIEFVIDGGGSVFTTGVKGDLEIGFNCTIQRWTILGDQSGSIVIDIWKDAYASFPPTVADTITGSSKPTVSSATSAQSSTLTGWTTTITAGDVLRFNVNSVSSFTRVTLALKVTKTP